MLTPLQLKRLAADHEAALLRFPFDYAAAHLWCGPWRWSRFRRAADLRRPYEASSETSATIFPNVALQPRYPRLSPHLKGVWQIRT